MRKLSFFILALITFSLSSCRELKEITFTGIENVNVLSVNKNGIEAEVSAKINNPNRMSFTVYSSDIDISVAGVDAGIASLMDKVKIKGKSEEMYTFKVKSDFSKLNITELPKLLSIMFSNSLKIGMKGNIKAGKGLLKKNIPVDLVQDVPLLKK